jgi:BASS family bile acid:Na+ symporter
VVGEEDALMHLLRLLLGNSSFVFVLAMVTGLAVGQGASWTEHALVPVLGVIMTVSICDNSTRVFTRPKEIVGPVAIAIVLNWILLGGAFVGLSLLLVSEPDFRNGYALMAAVPPAVAVIPLSYLLGGSTSLALVGNLGAYIAALALTPLISVLLLGTNLVEPTRLLVILAELIVAPILASRVIRRTRLLSVVERWRSPIANWGFFLVIYTIVGLNRDTFLQEPGLLPPLVAIAFICTFVVAEVINRVSRLLGVPKADRITMMLLGARKNDGLTAAIVLAFFGAKAAMPVAVFSAFSVIHFVWLHWQTRRMR